MKGLKKTLSILLVFALVFTSMITFTAKTTEAKVKSIKVAKKATVYVGKTKKLKVKVKVKGKKTSKKFTAKSSKKKIATVKVKKGKIIIKGKKPGKCKITVRSKANKKKKKVIKVTVKQPDITMDVSQFESGVYVLKFSRAAKISTSNVAVAVKRFQSGKYVKNIKIADLSTSDQKNYTLVLSDEDVSVRNGSHIRFTVTGVNKKPIVKEVEAYAISKNRLNTYVHTFKTGEAFDFDYSIEDYVGSPYGRFVKATGVPAGVKVTTKNGVVYVEGKVAKEGVYTTTILLEDEKGTQHTIKVTFVVGSNKKLTVYAPKKVCGVNAAAKQYYDSYSYIYVAGGNGYDYKFTVNDKAGIFNDQINNYGNESEWRFEAKAAKTYTGKFTVTDNQDSTIKASGTAVVEAKNTVKVSGKVTSTTGKGVPAEVSADATTYNENNQNFFWADCNNSGAYSMYVIPGKYDLSAAHNEAYAFAYNKNITKAMTQNFKLGLYQVTIKSNNKDFPASKFEDWRDANGRLLGYGDKLFLKPGSYSISSEGGSFLVSYTAKANFKVAGDTTVTATVTTSGTTVYPILSGDTVEIGSEVTYFSFVPNTTAQYTIMSSENTGDPRAYLYDENGNELAEDDDSVGDLNFIMTANLTQGKTYYLAIEDLDGNHNSAKITMSVG